MKPPILLLTLSLIYLGCMGCAADDSANSKSNLSSVVAGLTEAEEAALDACIQEATDCRNSRNPDSAECREIYECLPDRPEAEGAPEIDWRRFCEGVEERCAQSDAEVEDCDALMERCLEARLSAEECIQACVSDGHDEAACGDRCARADTGGGAESGTPLTAEECLSGCLEAGQGEAVCAERCSEIE